MMIETCMLEDAGVYPNVRGSNPHGELILSRWGED
jgi:hypothetical protein